MRKLMVGGMAMVLMSGLAQAGLDRALEAEYVKLLDGRTVIAKVDVKNIKIKKQVRGDQRAGMFGGENMDQTKDATQITPTGVSYYDEAHARPVMYAPSGSTLLVEDVDFGRGKVEVTVKSAASRESSVITFLLKDGDRETLDRMIAATFEVR